MWINGTHIAMIRGDTETLSISCTKDGEPYIEIGDIIYLTVKKNANTEEKLLQKEVVVSNNERVVIELIPEDTKDLSYGKYKYDIQLTKINGVVKTLIPASFFEIKEEITYE